MSAHRVARTSIDWAKCAKLVMEHDRAQFDQLRTHCLEPLSAIASLPEKLPQIDWNHYREKIGSAYNISDFESKYKAFTVPAVKEPTNLVKQLDSMEKADKDRLKKFVEANQKVIDECQDELNRWAKVPPIDHWLPEEYEQYVPKDNLDLITYTRYRDPVEQYLSLGYRRVRCMKEEEGEFNGRFQANLQAVHPN